MRVERQTEQVSKGLALAIVLRDIAENLRVDGEFAKKGRIIYSIDPHLIDILIDPINNLRDIQLPNADFYTSGVAGEAENDPFGLSIARMTLKVLFPETKASLIAKFIHPAYQPEIRLAAHEFSQRAQTASYLSQRHSAALPVEGELKKSFGRLAEIISAWQSGSLPILKAYTLVKRVIAGVLTYVLTPQSAPLQILGHMVTQLLEEEVWEKLKQRLSSEWAVRSDRHFDMVANKILEERLKRTSSMDRTPDQIDSAAVRDAEAILSSVIINEMAAAKGEDPVRVLFLTGDHTILRIFGSQRECVKVLGERSRHVYVRTLPEVLGIFGSSTPSGLSIQERIVAFDNFLEPILKKPVGDAYYVSLKDFRFGRERPEFELWDNDGVRKANSALANHLVTVTKLVLEAMDSPSLTKDIAIEMKHVEGEYPNLRDNVHEIFDLGWTASEKVSNFISQKIGVTVGYGEKARQQAEIEWTIAASLNHLERPSRAVYLRNGARFPCWLRFSDGQLAYLKWILDDRGFWEEGLGSSGTQSLEAWGGAASVTLVNAFLRGLAGDWRRAERLCVQASTIARTSVDGNDCYKESIYFRAVAVRHSDAPSIDRWRETLTDLKVLSERAEEDQSDLRYAVEYYASSLSVQYHAHFRGEGYKAVPCPSPIEAYTWSLSHADFLSWREGLTEYQLRSSIQFYTNLCLFFVFCHMIPPNLGIVVERRDAHMFLIRLCELIDKNRSWHRVSNYVEMVRAALEAELLHPDTSGKSVRWQQFSQKFGVEQFFPYDVEKYKDLAKYFLGSKA